MLSTTQPIAPTHELTAANGKRCGSVGRNTHNRPSSTATGRTQPDHQSAGGIGLATGQQPMLGIHGRLAKTVTKYTPPRPDENPHPAAAPDRSRRPHRSGKTRPDRVMLFPPIRTSIRVGVLIALVYQRTPGEAVRGDPGRRSCLSGGGRAKICENTSSLTASISATEPTVAQAGVGMRRELVPLPWKLHPGPGTRARGWTPLRRTSLRAESRRPICPRKRFNQPMNHEPPAYGPRRAPKSGPRWAVGPPAE